MFNKKFLSTVAPAALGVLAILLALFLNGAQLSDEYGKYSVKLIGLIFGGGEAVTKVEFAGEAEKVIMPYDGGMSIFGILGFLAVVGGIGLLALAYLKDNEKFILLGNAALVIGGLAMLLVLVTGTAVTMHGYEMSFAEFIGDLKLGLGAYAWTILCVGGGAFGLFNHKFR